MRQQLGAEHETLDFLELNPYEPVMYRFAFQHPQSVIGVDDARVWLKGLVDPA